MRSAMNVCSRGVCSNVVAMVMACSHPAARHPHVPPWMTTGASPPGNAMHSTPGTGAAHVRTVANLWIAPAARGAQLIEDGRSPAMTAPLQSLRPAPCALLVEPGRPLLAEGGDGLAVVGQAARRLVVHLLARHHCIQVGLTRILRQQFFD